MSTDGADPADIAWTFGDDLHPVLSDPVVDSQGRIRVVIGGRDAFPSYLPPEYPYRGNTPEEWMKEGYLVALDQNGVETARTPVCEWENLGFASPQVVLSIGPGDDVWVICGNMLQRVGSAGVQWSVPRDFFGQASAVSRDGWAYQYGTPPGTGTDIQLLALDPDGVRQWAAPVGFNRPGEWGAWATIFGAAPVVGTDGSVYSGCDTCADAQGGIGVFAPTTGALQFYGVNQPVPRSYGQALVGSGGAVYVSSGPGDHANCCDAPCDACTVCCNSGTLFFDGETLELMPDPAPVLIGADGPIRIKQSETSSVLVWNDQELPIGGTPTGPAALAEPGLVLLVTVSRLFSATPRTLNWNSYQLVGIDRSGATLFKTMITKIEAGIIPLDGLVLMRTTGRLQAVRAPIHGPSAGPWSTQGANLQGTYSADSFGP